MRLGCQRTDLIGLFQRILAILQQEVIRCDDATGLPSRSRRVQGQGFRRTVCAGHRHIPGEIDVLCRKRGCFRQGRPTNIDRPLRRIADVIRTEATAKDRGEFIIRELEVACCTIAQANRLTAIISGKPQCARAADCWR